MATSITFPLAPMPTLLRCISRPTSCVATKSYKTPVCVSLIVCPSICWESASSSSVPLTQEFTKTVTRYVTRSFTSQKSSNMARVVPTCRAKNISRLLVPAQRISRLSSRCSLSVVVRWDIRRLLLTDVETWSIVPLRKLQLYTILLEPLITCTFPFSLLPSWKP